MKVTPPTTYFFTLFNYIFQAAHRSYDTLQQIPSSEPILADSLSGRMKGTLHMSRGKTPFRFFRGIPYALAPIGRRRFEPPEEHPGWEGVLDATWYGTECVQVNMFTEEQHRFGDEDCLFLNVATRKTFLKGKLPTRGLRPVIFWIHGGFFMQGSSNFFAPNYFMQEDVVFVTSNYRVNSFGFLSSGDGQIQGNMGLKDQNMALRWVRDNIRYFNGDPDRISLMGESSGAVSAHLHTISRLSRGLFRGAVSMGGTGISPWALVTDPEEQTVRMAYELGCESRNMTKLIHCLKRLPVATITGYHTRVLERLVEGEHTLFGPTIEYHTPEEDAFLTDYPVKLMEQGDISNATWVNGVNSGEGAIFLLPIMHNDTLRKEVNRKWQDYAPIFMMYKDHPDAHKISTEVRHYYLDGQPLGRKTLPEAIEMMSDRGFFLDTHRAALLQAKVAPTYVYEYVYEGLLSFSALMFDKIDIPLLPAPVGQLAGGAKTLFTANFLHIRPKKKYGVCHGEELPLLFPWLFIRKDVKRNDDDYEISRKLIQLWVSFAEYGTPETPLIGESFAWPSVQDANPDLEEMPLKRIIINCSFSVEDERFYDRMQFWTKFNIL